MRDILHLPLFLVQNVPERSALLIQLPFQVLKLPFEFDLQISDFLPVLFLKPFQLFFNMLFQVDRIFLFLLEKLHPVSDFLSDLRRWGGFSLQNLLIFAYSSLFFENLKFQLLFEDQKRLVLGGSDLKRGFDELLLGRK